MKKKIGLTEPWRGEGGGKGGSANVWTFWFFFYLRAPLTKYLFICCIKNWPCRHLSRKTPTMFQFIPNVSKYSYIFLIWNIKQSLFRIELGALFANIHFLRLKYKKDPHFSMVQHSPQIVLFTIKLQQRMLFDILKPSYVFNQWITAENAVKHFKALVCY